MTVGRLWYSAIHQDLAHQANPIWTAPTLAASDKSRRCKARERQDKLRSEVSADFPRIARVSKTNFQLCLDCFLAKSWSGMSSIGFRPPRRRISWCFCICRVLAGQLCGRTRILDQCQTNNKMKQYRVWARTCCRWRPQVFCSLRPGVTKLFRFGEAL